MPLGVNLSDRLGHAAHWVPKTGFTGELADGLATRSIEAAARVCEQLRAG